MLAVKELSEVSGKALLPGFGDDEDLDKDEDYCINPFGDLHHWLTLDEFYSLSTMTMHAC